MITIFLVVFVWRGKKRAILSAPAAAFYPFAEGFQAEFFFNPPVKGIFYVRANIVRPPLKAHKSIF